MRGTRIPHLHGVKNYLNNYFAMYTRLTRSRKCVELASPGYMDFGDHLIINLLSPDHVRDFLCYEEHASLGYLGLGTIKKLLFEIFDIENFLILQSKFFRRLITSEIKLVSSC